VALTTAVEHRLGVIARKQAAGFSANQAVLLRKVMSRRRCSPLRSLGGPVGCLGALSNFVIGKFGRTEGELCLLGSPRAPQDAIRGSDKTSGVVLRAKKRLAGLIARLVPPVHGPRLGRSNGTEFFHDWPGRGFQLQAFAKSVVSARRRPLAAGRLHPQCDTTLLFRATLAVMSPTTFRCFDLRDEILGFTGRSLEDP